MSPRYALACPECQHSNEVTTKQAGQDISCNRCQQTINAPRLGQLKQLPVIEETVVNNKKSNKGGGLFVTGLLLLLIGGAGGGGLYYYASTKLVSYDVEEFLKTSEEEIDELPTIGLLQIYDSLPVDKGIGPWQERPYVGSNKQGIILRYISLGLLGIGGIGLLVAIAGLFR